MVLMYHFLSKYNYLIDELGISEEVVNYAIGIHGQTEEELKNVLFYFTSYRDFDQIESDFYD